MPKENKRKVLCPECEAEVEIIRDSEGTDEGMCDGCGLNVGQVLTKNRYNKALQNLQEREEKERRPNKKKGFFD